MLLVVYVLFIGGGWDGIYAVSLRTLSLVLVAAGLGTWFLLSLFDARWRPSTSIWPTLVLPVVALTLATPRFQWPRLGVEYIAWAVLLVGLYLLLVRVLATTTARERVGGLAAMLALVIGLLYVGTVFLTWVEWWGLVGHLAMPPFRPLFGGLSLGVPGTLQTVQVLATAVAITGLGVMDRPGDTSPRHCPGNHGLRRGRVRQSLGLDRARCRGRGDRGALVRDGSEGGFTPRRLHTWWSRRRSASPSQALRSASWSRSWPSARSWSIAWSTPGPVAGASTSSPRCACSRMPDPGPGSWHLGAPARGLHRARRSWTTTSRMPTTCICSRSPSWAWSDSCSGCWHSSRSIWLIWRALRLPAAETRRWAWCAVFSLVFLAAFNVTDFQMSVPSVLLMGALPIGLAGR